MGGAAGADLLRNWLATCLHAGHHVSRRFGWDCHGLPVEQETEKLLSESMGHPELPQTHSMSAYVAHSAAGPRVAVPHARAVLRAGQEHSGCQRQAMPMHSSATSSPGMLFKLADPQLIWW